MAYLLRLKKDGVEMTRLAATAIEAVVVIETYAAHGFVGGPYFTDDGRSQMTFDELKAEADREGAATAASA